MHAFDALRLRQHHINRSQDRRGKFGYLFCAFMLPPTMRILAHRLVLQMFQMTVRMGRL